MTTEVRSLSPRGTRGERAGETTHEAGFSLYSFGGEGWGEEAFNNVTALRPLSSFLGPFLERVLTVAGIRASSPRPSPPKEERGPTKRVLRSIVNQTHWQWGWGAGLVSAAAKGFG